MARIKKELTELIGGEALFMQITNHQKERVVLSYEDESGL